MLSQALQDVLRRFFTEHAQLQSFLRTVERQQLEQLLQELLNLYARDKNSSTLRAFISLAMAGYQPSLDKLGYDGTKVKDHRTVFAEAKPKNLERNRRDKFNGGGNFTDFTPERREKYLTTPLQMLVSGFLDGELVYILEFPYHCPRFQGRLQERLEKRFPAGQRAAGQYLRGLDFDWRHYQDCPVQVHFLNHEIAETEPERFTRDFHRWLVNSTT